jgi:hypothetical protein
MKIEDLPMGSEWPSGIIVHDARLRNRVQIMITVLNWDSRSKVREYTDVIYTRTYWHHHYSVSAKIDRLFPPKASYHSSSNYEK